MTITKPRNLRSKSSVIGALISASVLLAFSLLVSCSKKDTSEHLESAKVIHVRDGDTVELSDGRVVRYIGIDTPETGDPGADSATALNSALVLGKKVELEFGRERADRYGRTLAFIFIDGRMVNMELLKAGWAWCYFFNGNMKYSSQMVRAVRLAMDARRGLWSAPHPETDDHYIGSYAGFRFHRPDCPSVADIKWQNQRIFTAKDSAFFDGFAPCGNCRP